MKVSKAAIVRAIALLLSLVNVILELRGISIIPIDSEAISDAVSIIMLLVSAIAAWWKNNSFSKNAIKADEYLKALNDREKYASM